MKSVTNFQDLIFARHHSVCARRGAFSLLAKEFTTYGERIIFPELEVQILKKIVVFAPGQRPCTRELKCAENYILK